MGRTASSRSARPHRFQWRMTRRSSTRDKGLIKRVFSNLIQNAVTHSSQPVHLDLSARRARTGILFTVTDNGPGIPPEYHELIFRKFGQVEMPARAADAQLGPRPHFLQAGGGEARRTHLGEERGGEGSSFHIELRPTRRIQRGRGPLAASVRGARSQPRCLRSGSRSRRRLPVPACNAERCRPTVYIETYGCQMNVSDSELMLGKLTASGYDAVDRSPTAPM